MTLGTPRERLASLLRHESKSNTYKFALIRALNDLALEHPLLPPGDVIVPLRRVAERWLVYYWAFVGPQPVLQGARAQRGETLTQDMSFRPVLTQLRLAWEQLPYAKVDASQGALLLADYRVGRGRLPEELQRLTTTTLQAISAAVRQPVRYAGGQGPHMIFSAPAPVHQLAGYPLPGTHPAEVAFSVPAVLWRTLLDMSLWVEALCLHEWSLYIEGVAQTPTVNRGEAFTLLTTKPDTRVPLTWERNQVRVQMLEGMVFHCPWTGGLLTPERFDLDHLVPVSTFPINELWNLLPSDPAHNSHVKRNRIPSVVRLNAAQPVFEQTYEHYQAGNGTQNIFEHDVQSRFGQRLAPPQLAQKAARLADLIAHSRNVPRY